MEKVNGLVSRLKAHLMRRKKRYLLLVLLLATAILFAAIALPRMRSTQKAQNAGGFSYVRTTTLTRTTLEDTVSATGTVESADVSTVTTNLNAAVKTVSVAVGDYVEAGDVICTLDTSEIEKQITRAKENLQDSIDRAQESYEKAVERYNEAVETYEDYEDDYTDARKAYRSAYSDYKDALNRIETLQNDADDAEDALQDAAGSLADAKSSLKKAESALEKYQESDGYESGSDEEKELEADIEAAQEAVSEAETAYADAEEEFAQADDELKLLKDSLSFDSLQSDYEKKLSAYESAQEKYEDYEDTVKDREEEVETALEDVQDAQESDDLEDLYDELEDYTLKAETSGYVTSLNATVGSRLSESNVATIQDTENLVISISIAEYDIESVKLGMRAIITSDSVEGEIEGELTQLAPTATVSMGSSSTFAAEVSVLGGSNGLLIGVNAKVQLVVSSTEDVFVVPYDAVGENADGEKIVYVKTGGSGTDMTFEEVVVETGAQTDYYIEIHGDGLEEGMEVRASADLTEATYTAAEDETEENEGVLNIRGGMGNVGQATNGGNRTGMPNGGGMPGQMPGGM